MGRASKAETAERIEAVEQALIAGTSRSRIERLYAKRWGLKERQIRRYIQKVEERWAEEAAKEEKAHPDHRMVRRNWVREVLRAQLLRASARRRTLKDAEGGELVDEDGNPITTPDPDEKTVTQVVRTMIKLDGLAEPDRKEIDLRGGVAVEARIGLEARTTHELVAFIQSGRLPPGQSEGSLPKAEENGQKKALPPGWGGSEPKKK